MRVPPNLSKMLRDWIGPEELEKNSVLCVGTPWIDCECGPSLRALAFTECGNLHKPAVESGEHLGYEYWNSSVMKETGGDLLLMEVGDPHDHDLVHPLRTQILAVHRPPQAIASAGRLRGRTGRVRKDRGCNHPWRTTTEPNIVNRRGVDCRPGDWSRRAYEPCSRCRTWKGGRCRASGYDYICRGHSCIRNGEGPRDGQMDEVQRGTLRAIHITPDP